MSFTTSAVVLKHTTILILRISFILQNTTFPWCILCLKYFILIVGIAPVVQYIASNTMLRLRSRIRAPVNSCRDTIMCGSFLYVLTVPYKGFGTTPLLRAGLNICSMVSLQPSSRQLPTQSQTPARAQPREESSQFNQLHSHGLQHPLPHPFFNQAYDLVPLHKPQIFFVQWYCFVWRRLLEIPCRA